jgi:ParB family chromosome partitioning protein
MVFDLSALDAHLPNGPVPGAAAFAPLASFEEDPDNPRFEDDPAAFELLVADVRQHGILQPVIVRRIGNGKLQIRFGARRCRAARELGLASIPYVVTEDARQFDDYSQVAENQHRANMQPLELAAFAAKSSPTAPCWALANGLAHFAGTRNY